MVTVFGVMFQRPVFALLIKPEFLPTIDDSTENTDLDLKFDLDPDLESDI